jgi:murein DD-endopeptidase MepM/ murein hydrolase activator NlpD
MFSKRKVYLILSAALGFFLASNVNLLNVGKQQPAIAQTLPCDTVTTVSPAFTAKTVVETNVRSGRSISSDLVKKLPANQTFYFDAWGYGDEVMDTGYNPPRPDRRWYKLQGENGWVASAVLIGNAPNSSPTCSGGSSGSGQINLPFGKGQTWYACQGYQGPISHKNTFSLDLTVARQDVGRTGCWAVDGNVNKSAGKSVLAPAAGTVAYVGADLVCLTLDSNRSLLIGHLNRTVANGARVSQDTQLGTVSTASKANGGYAHIHIEARNGAGCPLPVPQRSVPFTNAKNFQFIGVGDLPDLPGSSDHQGKALTRS